MSDAATPEAAPDGAVCVVVDEAGHGANVVAFGTGEGIGVTITLAISSAPPMPLGKG